MKKKEFTEHQLKRLPKEGYWVEVYKSDHYEAVSFYCIFNGMIKYKRNDLGPGGEEWSTLLWSCMATKKMIDKANSDKGSNVTYLYYESFEDLIKASSKYNIKMDKAPNDF